MSWVERQAFIDGWNDGATGKICARMRGTIYTEAFKEGFAARVSALQTFEALLLIKPKRKRKV